MSRKSLTERLFDGGMHLGKYIGTGAVALSLLGCDHIPKPISVSEDGRYIAYSAKENGEIQPLGESYKEATMVLYDTQQNEVVDTFEIDGPPIWPTNTGDTVAYMSAPDGTIKESETLSSVVVYSGGKKETIRRAAYPELSADGKYLAFTRGFGTHNGDDESDCLSLILREIATGKERNLETAGLASDFSPDSKSLVYVVFKVHGTNNDGAYVETLDLMTGDKKRFGEVNILGERPNVKLIAHPRWIDDNRIMYTGKAKEGKDSEIFIATRGGSVTQVTDNDLEEICVNMTPDGKVSYVGFDPNSSRDNPSSFIAKQSVMGWESKKDEEGKCILKTAGNNAILRGRNDELYITPISNLKEVDSSKLTDISTKVRTHLKVKKIIELGGAIIDLFEDSKDAPVK